MARKPPGSVTALTELGRVRRIDSYITPKGCLTQPGMGNHRGDHSASYTGFPAPVPTGA